MLCRLFPAHAGVILRSHVPPIKLAAFPRPCGGDPDAVDAGERRVGFSLPTRG